MLIGPAISPKVFRGYIFLIMLVTADTHIRHIIVFVKEEERMREKEGMLMSTYRMMEGFINHLTNNNKTNEPVPCASR